MTLRPTFLFAASAAIVLIASFAAQAQVPAGEPPAPAAAVAPALPSPNLAAAGDMLASLSANPNFSILVSALKATNLSPILSSVPQLTLFAPTDAAFHNLPPATLAALTKPDNLPLLQKILTYHLVHLDLDAAKVKGAQGPVATVETATIEVDGFGPTPKVNDADILQEGVHASNGWLYPIDKVLTPPGVTLPTN
jgi:uncharacterized surface protein with fasciclin (FAS1) repeats